MGLTNSIAPTSGGVNTFSTTMLLTLTNCNGVHVHGRYRAHAEHWGLVRNMWRGGPNELHKSGRVLLHFTHFCIRRQVSPYGPWDHVPLHVWTDISNCLSPGQRGHTNFVCVEPISPAQGATQILLPLARHLE